MINCSPWAPHHWESFTTVPKTTSLHHFLHFAFAFIQSFVSLTCATSVLLSSFHFHQSFKTNSLGPVTSARKWLGCLSKLPHYTVNIFCKWSRSCQCICVVVKFLWGLFKSIRKKICQAHLAFPNVITMKMMTTKSNFHYMLMVLLPHLQPGRACGELSVCTQHKMVFQCLKTPLFIQGRCRPGSLWHKRI